VYAFADFLNPALPHDSLDAGVGQMTSAGFWFAVLQIIFINVLLSGDNAVVIAMACRGLPPHQRRWGLIIGAGVAVVLLIAFAAIINRLMLVPYLKLLGGIALLYIAAKLLVPEHRDRTERAAVAHLWRAIWLVVVADIIMSFDNIIAVVATAHGNLLLLGIGLAVSIPLILAGAALVMTLLEHAPILIWLGAALLGWLAGEVMATDPAIFDRVVAKFDLQTARHVAFAASGSCAVLAVAIGGLWRRLQEVALSRAAARGHAARA
jgi:YjbE family integral membrane protein